MFPLALISSITLSLTTLNFVTSKNNNDSVSKLTLIKNKRICRSCGELAQVVTKKMEETARNPRVIQVAARIGADGRPISGRKIDYLSSESRFLDVFGDICDDLGHSAKSACYLITNDYEDQLKEWFKKGHLENNFLKSFCFKELPNCDQEVYENSLSDIEIENYEADKDKIDDDFMPEAKEENVKAQENNFSFHVVEKIKDIRDNALDAWDSFDNSMKTWMSKNLIENKALRVHIDKLFKEEHYEFFKNNWYIGILTILISMILPVIFVILILKRTSSTSSSPSAVATSKRKSTRTTRSKSKAE